MNSEMKSRFRFLGDHVPPVLFWVLCGLLSVVGFFPFHAMPTLSVDLAETVYVARAILAGRTPYREIFTHHFIGYVLPFCALGLFIPLSPRVLWCFALLWNLLTAYALSRFISRATGRRDVGNLGALLTVTVGLVWGWGGVTLNIQSVVMPLLVLYLIVLLPFVTEGDVRSPVEPPQNPLRVLFQAGVLLGALICCDQRLCVFAPLLALASSRRSLTPLRLCVVLGSVSVLPLFCLGLLAAGGALRDFFSQTILFPLTLRNADLKTSFSERYLLLLIGGLEAELVPVLVAVVGGLQFFLTEQREEFRLFISVYFLSALLYAALGGRPFAHYLLPCLPLLVFFLANLPRTLERQPTWAMVAGWSSIIFLILGSLLRPVFLYQDTGSLLYAPNEDSATRTAALVRGRATSPTDLFVVGYAPQIYNLSNQLSPFRDLGLLSVAGANFESPTVFPKFHVASPAAAEFLTFLNTTPPRIIVEFQTTPAACGRPDRVCPQENLDIRRSEALRPLRDLIETRYTLIGRFESLLDRAYIYLDRDE